MLHAGAVQPTNCMTWALSPYPLHLFPSPSTPQLVILLHNRDATARTAQLTRCTFPTALHLQAARTLVEAPCTAKCCPCCPSP